MRERANSLGLSLNVLEASTEAELDSVFAGAVQQAVGALLVAQEPTYNRWHEHIVALAERHKMPAMYGSRIYAEAGGLMTYDASVPDSMRQVGVYVGRILKGEKPGDLPIVSCNRPSSSWSSISGPRNRLASKFQRSCSR
jgi:putative ABC transport system substrate-binding protein